MSQTIVIHGPQGCGKTRNAQALAKHFGCKKVVDDWDGRSKVEEGSLVLTNSMVFGIKASALPVGRRFIPFSSAMAEAGLARTTV
jgi:MoxR-like ATPase